MARQSLPVLVGPWPSYGAGPTFGCGTTLARSRCSSMTAHKRKPVDPKENPRERQVPDVAAEDLQADGPPYGSDSVPLPASAPHAPAGLGRHADHSAEWSVAVEALAELPYAVYAATASGVLLYANRAMLSLLGANSLRDLGQRSLGSFCVPGSSVPETTLPAGQLRVRGVNNTEHYVEHVTFSAPSNHPWVRVAGGRGPSRERAGVWQDRRGGRARSGPNQTAG